MACDKVVAEAAEAEKGYRTKNKNPTQRCGCFSKNSPVAKGNYSREDDDRLLKFRLICFTKTQRGLTCEGKIRMTISKTILAIYSSRPKP